MYRAAGVQELERPVGGPRRGALSGTDGLFLERGFFFSLMPHFSRMREIEPKMNVKSFYEAFANGGNPVVAAIENHGHVLVQWRAC